MNKLKEFVLETVCPVLIMVTVVGAIIFGIVAGMTTLINHDGDKKCIKISDEMPNYEYVGLTPTNQCVYKNKDTSEVKVLNVGN